MYARVSTGRQGRSGLKLDAQRAAIEQSAQQHRFDLRGTYIEVETGKGHDALARRPKLAAALAHAKKLKAPVIVSKLCRLGRDVHFISGLMSNRVPFIVAELGPEVDPFMLHIYAAVAQKERSLISARTSEALQAAKRRGVKLGKTGKMRAVENKAAAEARAKAMSALIAELRSAGVASVRAIALELNRRGIPHCERERIARHIGCEIADSPSLGPGKPRGRRSTGCAERKGQL
jgi:DNA invertase Pin-like site-specific DNA recombinase